MHIKLYSKERTRVSTDREENFINIKSLEFEIGLAIDLYPIFHYIEIRKNKLNMRIFLFKNKREKKDYDFGEIWKEAEIVYSLNNVIHK